MVIEWCPQPNGINAETGDHGCSKLACGHFTCVLVGERDANTALRALQGMEAEILAQSLPRLTACAKISDANTQQDLHVLWGDHF